MPNKNRENSILKAQLSNKSEELVATSKLLEMEKSKTSRLQEEVSQYQELKSQVILKTSLLLMTQLILAVLRPKIINTPSPQQKVHPLHCKSTLQSSNKAEILTSGLKFKLFSHKSNYCQFYGRFTIF